MITCWSRGLWPCRRMNIKHLLSRAPPCFRRHVKPFVTAADALVSTHQLCVVGNGPFSLCVIHKDGLCPSCKDINKLMIMMNFTFVIFISKLRVYLKHYHIIPYHHPGVKEWLFRSVLLTKSENQCPPLTLQYGIIISPLQSTAGHRALQLLAISLDIRLLASSSC
jgi:hypothetical protein